MTRIATQSGLRQLESFYLEECCSAGLATCLYHAGGATSNLSVQSSQGNARSAGPDLQSARPGAGAGGGLPGGSLPKGGFAPGGGSPLLGDRSGAASPGAEAPFSSSWREGATPSPTGPSGSAGEGAPGPGGSASGSSGASGLLGGSQSPASSPSYRGGTRRPERSGGTARESWQGEAQKLAGRARALSGQLGQLEREASRSDGKKETSGGALGEASTASASESDDREVPNPPNVPIDDHLHWLVVAGLLWGIWRLSG